MELKASFTLGQDDSLGLHPLNQLNPFSSAAQGYEEDSPYSKSPQAINEVPSGSSPVDNLPKPVYDLEDEDFEEYIQMPHTKLVRLWERGIVPYWELPVFGLDRASRLAEFLFPALVCAQRLYTSSETTSLKVVVDALRSGWHEIRFETPYWRNRKPKVAMLIYIFCATETNDRATSLAPSSLEFSKITTEFLDAVESNNIPAGLITDLQDQSLTLRIRSIRTLGKRVPRHLIMDALVGLIGYGLSILNCTIRLYPNGPKSPIRKAQGCIRPSHLIPSYEGVTCLAELDLFEARQNDGYLSAFLRKRQGDAERWLDRVEEKGETLLLTPASDFIESPLDPGPTPIGRLVSQEDPLLDLCQRTLSFATRHPRLPLPFIYSPGTRLLLKEAISVGLERWAQLFRAYLIDDGGKEIMGPFVFKLFDERFYRPPGLDEFFEAEKFAMNEVRAYQKMVLLQGSSIPHFYGIWKVTLSDGTTCLGVLMEYICGLNFRAVFITADIEAPDIVSIASNGSDDFEEKMAIYWMRVFDKVAASVAAINLLGIYHADLERLDNIFCLVSETDQSSVPDPYSPQRPTHLDPVIIDFGLSQDLDGQMDSLGSDQAECLLEDRESIDQLDLRSLYDMSTFSKKRTWKMEKWWERLGDTLY